MAICLLFICQQLREALKKNIESWTAIKPPGLVVIVLRLFFLCTTTVCMPPGSPKTYYVFSLNAMCHMFSKLFESQNLTSHLIFVKSGPNVSMCFYGQNK